MMEGMEFTDHPSVISGREGLRQALSQARDAERRDAWVRSKASGSILVAEGVTLADVQRWLKEALQ